MDRSLGRQKELLLKFLGRCQAMADRELREHNGVDCPLLDDRPGREHEVMDNSDIAWLGRFKARSVEV
jgi:hypothetical protein